MSHLRVPSSLLFVPPARGTVCTWGLGSSRRASILSSRRLTSPRKLAREVDHPATLPRGGRFVNETSVAQRPAWLAAASLTRAPSARAGLDHLPFGPRGSTVSGRQM